MSDEPRYTAAPGYAFGQLQRALDKAASENDSAAREQAEAKVAAWRAVLDGMAAGRLAVGSRSPVADTPVWVTLEVAHGGFATGRFLAEQPLSEAEVARLRTLPQDLPGATDRERLNLFYLSDAGQVELVAALASGTYRIDVPEDAALLVVAWLLDRGHHKAALDLVVRLRPLMHRLRMTPRLEHACSRRHHRRRGESMRGQIRLDEVESAVLKVPHLTGLRQFPATEISVSETRDWARSLLSLGVPSPVLDDVLLCSAKSLPTPSPTPTPAAPPLAR